MEEKKIQFKDIISSDTVDLLKDGGELMIDSLIPETIDNLAKEIPVIKSVYAFVSVIKGYTDYILMKKIICFLNELDTISEVKKKKFLNDLNSNQRERIVESLVLLLDKHEYYERSQWQGKLFNAFISGKIIKSEYDTLTYAVNNILLNKMSVIIKIYSHEKNMHISESEKIHFSSLQLLSFNSSSVGLWDGGAPTYDKNEVGQKFVDIIRT